MTLKRFFLCLLALLTACAPALAAVSVIQPTDDFYVNDAADVLSDATEGHIILNNDALYEACGAQLVFVTLDTVASTTLENYAYTLYNDWGIGKDGRGILVLMTIEDDDYWIVQGTGLQDYVTSGDLDEMIVNDLEPYFAAKDYDTGAKTLFDSLFSAVTDALNVDLAVDDTLYDQYIAQFDPDSGTVSQTSDNPSDNPAVDLIRKKKTGRVDQPLEIKNNDDSDHPLLGFIILIVIILLIANSRRRAKIRRYSGTQPVRRSRPVVTPVVIPRTSRPPTRTFGSSYGSSRSSYGGSHSSYGGSHSSFGSSHSSFGSSHSSFGSSSRSSGFGGGRSGGGGHTRGGGAGRHR